MSDLLGEALARWEGWEMGDPYDPGTLDQLLAAARNWHALTQSDKRAWYCSQAGGDPTKHQRIRESCFKNRNHPGDWCGFFVVDALTDTTEPEQ